MSGAGARDAGAGEAGGRPGPWWKRVAWLVLIWAASVAAVGVVGLVIRFWLKP